MSESTGALSTEVASTDGRHARRARNRDAVISAYLELVAAGNLAPTIEEVADHSGISFRSIYRYFSNVETLVAEVAVAGLEQVKPMMVIENEGVGPLAERIDTFVSKMVDLHVTCAPLTESARTRPAGDGIVESTFATIRSMVGRQISNHFAPELVHLGHDDRKAKVGAMFVAFTYDSLRMLHEMYPTEPQRVRSILTEHLELHLAAR